MRITEEQFLDSLLDSMAMSPDEERVAQQALVDMVSGNPIGALRTGVMLAEQVLSRTRKLILERQKALNDNEGEN